MPEALGLIPRVDEEKGEEEAIPPSEPIRCDTSAQPGVNPEHRPLGLHTKQGKMEKMGGGGNSGMSVLLLSSTS